MFDGKLGARKDVECLPSRENEYFSYYAMSSSWQCQKKPLPTESAIHAVAKHQLYLVWHPCLSLVWQTASHCSFPYFLIQGKNATASFSDFLLLFLSTLLRIFLIHSSFLSSLGWTGSMPVSFFSWECYSSSSIPMNLIYPDVSTLPMFFVEQGGRNR